jgi:hypothetical protein
VEVIVDIIRVDYQDLIGMFGVDEAGV